MTAGMNTAVVDELIEMRGLRFHFRDWPSWRVDAPSLVLLMDIPAMRGPGTPSLEPMTDRYRVLALDQPGHGETDWAEADPYGIDDMADDLEAFVRALGLRASRSSAGPWVAWWRWTCWPPPEALAACVIVDIGPEIVQSGSGRIQASVQAVDIFASRDEAFAAARAANSRPPEELHRHRLHQPDADRRWPLELSL